MKGFDITYISRKGIKSVRVLHTRVQHMENIRLSERFYSIIILTTEMLFISANVNQSSGKLFAVQIGIIEKLVKIKKLTLTPPNDV